VVLRSGVADQTVRGSQWGSALALCRVTLAPALLVSGLLTPYAYSLAVTNNQVLQFGRLSHVDGLSQDSVRCVLQDRAGFLWFGTVDGLNRYSGQGFDVFRADPDDPQALADDFISALYEDSAGMLWVGTDEGIHRFDPGRGTFTRFPSPLRAGREVRERPLAFLEQTDGTLLVVMGPGVWVLDPRTAVVKRVDDGSVRGLFTSLMRDRHDRLWVGAQAGLFMLDGSHLVPWRRALGAPAALGAELGQVNSICLSPDGTMWIATEEGLVRLRENAGGALDIFCFHHRPEDPRSLPGSRVRKMAFDAAGGLWLATRSGAAWLPAADVTTTENRFVCFRYNPSSRESLADEAVEDVLVDRSGVIWFATYGGGLTRIASHHQPLTPYTRINTPTMLGESVQAAGFDRQGVVWIGTDAGLHSFEPGSGKVVGYRPRPEYLSGRGEFNAKAILEDRSGVLWVGNPIGIYQFDRADGSLERWDHEPNSKVNVRVMFEDRYGVLWVGARSGLFAVDRENQAVVRHQGPGHEVLDGAFVYAIAEDRAGALMLGTLGRGVVVLARDAKGDVVEVTRLTHEPSNPASLSSNDVISIRATRDGTVWFGTTNGLDHWLGAGRGVVRYTEKDGLPNPTVYSVLEDAFGRLWMSTNNGVARLTPQSGAFRKYYLADGLPSTEFNGGAYCQTPSGLLVFGGIRGFCTVLPGQDSQPTQLASVALTELSISGRSHRLPIADRDGPFGTANRPLRLASRERSIGLAFAVLDFVDPKRNHFEYYLEGFERNWSPVGSRSFASYSNLAPARYVFHVRGATSLGVGTKQDAVFYFEIVPALWQRWWFRALLLLGVVLAGAALYREHSQVLRRRLEKDHLEQRLKLKADLTAMVVHDLRTPLTCILAYSSVLKVKADKRVAEAVVAIRESANRMIELINDMLDLSKLEAGKLRIKLVSHRLTDVIERTVHPLEPLLEAKDLKLTLVGDDDGPIEIDGQRIGQVVMNLVANAIKFAPTGSCIEIIQRRVQERDQWFREVTVTDRGPGVDEAHQQYLFNPYAQFEQPDGQKIHKGTGLGLAVSRLIIEMHGGEIFYRRLSPHGAAFTFRIPERPAPQAES
jgi:signal transduction histidine kinase/ligand-binding sensor domain-containing protein